MLLMNMTYTSGIFLFLRLCSRHAVTALGKAHSISRKSTEMTCLQCQAALIVSTIKWRELVVDLPGCPLKWVAGIS